VSAAVQTRPAGWIYLIHITGDPVAYVGQTVQPPGVRIEWHRRNQPWGSQILPGRQGYTIIRRVDTYGSPTLDAIALDLAEAEEIERRNPTFNGNRPDPAIFHARMADALTDPTANPTARPARRSPRSAPHPTRPVGGNPTRPRGVPRPMGRRGFPWGLVGRCIVGAAWAWVALRVGVNVAHNTGTPWWPWVATPVAFLIGPVLSVAVLRGMGWWPKPRRRGRRRH
jgi:hypothetical protein